MRNRIFVRSAAVLIMAFVVGIGAHRTGALRYEILRSKDHQY
jgi:hypothetical protein